ncbi:MAG TPA: SLC13 family permease, partial [Blastocatellia bacterium]|nr:SLC13 family permease [Blastocatellia bacterium]
MTVAFVYIILLLAIFLFVTEALPMDMVAVLMLLTLALAGIVTPAEAFVGFGDPVIITLISFFVISAALFNTGVIEAIGYRLHRIAGESELRLLVVIM